MSRRRITIYVLLDFGWGLAVSALEIILILFIAFMAMLALSGIVANARSRRGPEPAKD